VDRTGHPETTRGEQRKHQAAVRAAAEAGLPAPVGPDREVLRARVRSALAGSDGWDEFAGRLRLSGVQVRERYSTVNPGELTGYAVALLPSSARDWEQGTTWFGGGKLAPDLSLPQLRARWEDGETAGSESVGWQAGAGRTHTRAGTSTSARPGSSEDLSKLDRQRLWAAAQQAVHRADTDIKHASSHPFDPAAQAAAQAAAASAGEVLGAVSWLVHRTRGGPLHTAAEDYGRAARDMHRRTVPGTSHSRSTRTAAGALLRAGIVKRAETRQLLSLLAQLTALSESLARLREVQGRAAQARAARHAAEHLSNIRQRRAAAASAAMPRAVSSAVAGAATQAPVSVQLPPPHRAMPGPATRGWSPSR
jgi:hypothetical protein